MGELITLAANYDPQRVKFEHWEKQQYQTGRYELRTLVDTAFSRAYSDTLAEGESIGATESDGWDEGEQSDETDSIQATHTKGTADGTAHGDQKSSGEVEGNQRGNDLVTRAYTDAQHKARAAIDTTNHQDTESDARGRGRAVRHGRRRGRSGSRTRNREASRNRTRNTSQAWNVSYRQQLIPIFDWRDVLKFKEFLSYEEQHMMDAATIARLRTGIAIMVQAGKGVAEVAIPLIEDPLECTPRFAAKTLAAFNANLAALPYFHEPAKLLVYRQELIQALIQRIEERLAKPRFETLDADQLQLPHPDDDSPLGI